MKTEIIDYAEAKKLYQLGFSPRQIAAKLGVSPSHVKQQAAIQNWIAGAAVNWLQLRNRYENGEEIVSIAKSSTVSLSTLQKRKLREKWSRKSITGLDALRRSVSALQTALDNVPADDQLLTTRISTALSMAAGRLSRAESGQSPDTCDENEVINQADTDYAMAEFLRLMQSWRKDK